MPNLIITENLITMKNLKQGDFIVVTSVEGEDKAWVDDLFEVDVIDGDYIRATNFSTPDFFVITLCLDKIEFKYPSKDFIDSVISTAGTGLNPALSAMTIADLTKQVTELKELLSVVEENNTLLIEQVDELKVTPEESDIVVYRGVEIAPSAFGGDFMFYCKVRETRKVMPSMSLVKGYIDRTLAEAGRLAADTNEEPRES